MSLVEEAVIARYDRDILRAFASRLSVKLGRKFNGEKDYLSAYDFSYEIVELEFDDDSKMRFEYAFVVDGDEYYAVFTEHCGYHCVYKRSIVEAKISYPGSRKKSRYLKRKEPG